MSLYQLQELASRQQEQIESTHRLIMNKEQRLNYLSSVQDSQQGPIFDYDQNVSHFKEKIALQEAKLRKLRLLKNQIQKQRCSNSNMCSEVETIKILFKEKEKEWRVALTKIDALTRQLDELKKGNTANSYNINGYKHGTELEKLRQELLHKTKICKQNEEEIIHKRNMLYKRKSDVLKIDQKINELQTRLTRKRQLNQQLSIQMHGVRSVPDNEDLSFASKNFMRSSMGHSITTYKVPYSPKSPISNIATVEPLQRYKGSVLQYEYAPSIDYGLAQANKQDPKYQTLPYNTKFGSRNLNVNYSTPKQMEDNSNGGSRNFSAMPDHHDSNEMSVPSANDISLIIGHKSDSKDTSLEERPSPSGSSGSSDRISSSMAAYSFSDKMGLNGLSSDNRYFSNLDKGYRRTDECLNDNTGLYSQQYVPNVSAVGKTQIKESSSGANDCSKSNSVLDSFYKTKPSVPVKPIANSNEGDVVDNCRYDTNFMFNQKSHRSSGESSALSTPSSGVYSSSEIFSPSGNSVDKNGNNNQMDFDEDFNDVDNLRNQQIEERSTVSEIVNRLNNWSVSNGSQDWEKLRRRPVVSANEMEQELTQDANAAAIAFQQSGSPAREKLPADGKESQVEKNSPNKCHTKGQFEEDLTNNNHTNSNTDTNGDNRQVTTSEKKEVTKLKRIKGSLKSKDSNKRTMKIPLGRRVSFDPLALLLDASLEGELELVKKTSLEVPNPSASNDEGISALHNSVCAGHFDIVKYLVEIGCDVNVQDSDGWTPLHCAASCNNLVMIKFLVKSGACIFATTFSDHETAAEKCEEDEEGFDGCSQYLYGVQEQIGTINNGMVFALYDYESQNADELNFKIGDAIQVLRKGDDREKEWWWSKADNHEGYVPRNLVGMYPRIKPSYK